jgi:hypothetical protein
MENMSETRDVGKIGPDDIDAIFHEWERQHPGKKADDMSQEEFVRRCMRRLMAKRDS